MKSFRGGRFVPYLKPLSRAFGWVPKSLDVDLVHAYQRLPINGPKFVVSFDAEMPNMPEGGSGIAKRLAWSMLRSDRCRHLLPHSHHALELFRSSMAGFAGLQDVLRKTSVVYPAVSMGVERREWLVQGVPTILFVGRLFFIKGGHLMLEALKRLQSRHAFRLVVVSNLHTIDWFRTRLPSDVALVKEKIAALGGDLYEELPNAEVLSLMNRSDILLLPSISETFGFVLIEALAAGLVPVASGIRAIPEIVCNGETGLLLNAPVDSKGCIDSSLDYESVIVSSLESQIESLLEDPSRITRMGRNAQEVARMRFSTDRLKADLRKIYAEA
jgi:glycosyltransferase involved in cell wall biosynthesis